MHVFIYLYLNHCSEFIVDEIKKDLICEAITVQKSKLQEHSCNEEQDKCSIAVVQNTNIQFRLKVEQRCIILHNENRGTSPQHNKRDSGSYSDASEQISNNISNLTF